MSFEYSVGGLAVERKIWRLLKSIVLEIFLDRLKMKYTFLCCRSACILIALAVVVALH